MLYNFNEFYQNGVMFANKRTYIYNYHHIIKSKTTATLIYHLLFKINSI